MPTHESLLQSILALCTPSTTHSLKQALLSIPATTKKTASFKNEVVMVYGQCVKHKQWEALDVLLEHAPPSFNNTILSSHFHAIRVFDVFFTQPQPHLFKWLEAVKKDANDSFYNCFVQSLLKEAAQRQHLDLLWEHPLFQCDSPQISRLSLEVWVAITPGSKPPPSSYQSIQDNIIQTLSLREACVWMNMFFHPHSPHHILAESHANPPPESPLQHVVDFWLNVLSTKPEAFVKHMLVDFQKSLPSLDPKTEEICQKIWSMHERAHLTDQLAPVLSLPASTPTRKL